MMHTLRLSKQLSDELEEKLDGKPKSKLFREAIEEKLDRKAALQHLLDAEEEVIERVKTRLDQAVNAKLAQLEQAMLNGLGTITSFNQFTEAFGNLLDEMKDLIEENRQLHAERTALNDRVMTEMDWTVRQLTGEVEHAPNSNGAGGGGDTIFNPFASSLPKRT